MALVALVGTIWLFPSVIILQKAIGFLAMPAAYYGYVLS